MTSSIKRIFATSLCLLALTGGASANTVPSALSGLNPKVLAGEVVATRANHPDSSVAWGKAVGIVDAPIEAVSAVVQDYARYKDFMPSFTQSRVLSRRGDKALVYIEVEAAHGAMTLWANLKIVPRQADNGSRVVQASMMKGNLSLMEAVWELTPLPEGRTLVTFKMIVDPKVPVPSSLVSTENEKASRRGLSALRKQLTAGTPRGA